MKVESVDLNKIAFVLTLILAALKLDGILVIPWIMVVFPFWFLLLVAAVLVVYSIIH